MVWVMVGYAIGIMRRGIGRGGGGNAEAEGKGEKSMYLGWRSCLRRERFDPFFSPAANGTYNASEIACLGSIREDMTDPALKPIYMSSSSDPVKMRMAQFRGELFSAGLSLGKLLTNIKNDIKLEELKRATVMKRTDHLPGAGKMITNHSEKPKG